MINVPLLRKELEFITAHPELWDQGQWLSKCGTYGCLAGNVAIHSATIYRGCVILSEDQFHLQDPSWTEEASSPACSIKQYAQAALGLNDDQASLLFSAGNELEDLWSFANQFTNGEIEIPPDLETD